MCRRSMSSNSSSWNSDVIRQLADRIIVGPAAVLQFKSPSNSKSDPSTSCTRQQSQSAAISSSSSSSSSSSGGSSSSIRSLLPARNHQQIGAGHAILPLESSSSSSPSGPTSPTSPIQSALSGAFKLFTVAGCLWNFMADGSNSHSHSNCDAKNDSTSTSNGGRGGSGERGGGRGGGGGGGGSSSQYLSWSLQYPGQLHGQYRLMVALFVAGSVIIDHINARIVATDSQDEAKDAAAADDEPMNAFPLSPTLFSSPTATTSN